MSLPKSLCSAVDAPRIGVMGMMPKMTVITVAEAQGIPLPGDLEVLEEREEAAPRSAGQGDLRADPMLLRGREFQLLEIPA